MVLELREPVYAGFPSSLSKHTHWTVQVNTESYCYYYSEESNQEVALINALSKSTVSTVNEIYYGEL